MAQNTRKRKTPAPKIMPDFDAGQWTGITPDILAKWKKACPYVYVEVEIAAAL